MCNSIKLRLYLPVILSANIDRRAVVSRGKGVGGGSLINGLVYSRGNRLDYDEWAQLINDPSWNYQNVLPYFKKSEQFTRTNLHVPTDYNYHGFEGPSHISQAYPMPNVSNSVLKAAKQLGHRLTDYNGREQQGFSVLQHHMKDGKRFESDYAFIFPALLRRNLEVLDRSYVTKVVFYRNSNKVKGVIFTRNKKTYIARCKKEVVLSAGAINSPQILMLSGIGPRDHLKSLKIPVIQNLPVGNNLLDHPITILIFSSNISAESINIRESLKELLVKGQGPLIAGFCDAVGFLKSPVEKIENYPDVEIMFTNVTGSRDILTKYYGFTEEVFRTIQPTNGQNLFSIQIINLNQKSVGTLRLKSSDPFEYPLIDLNLLSDKDNHDIEILYQGIQAVLRLTETTAFRGLNVSLALDRFPGCDAFRRLSREYWYCYIRRMLATGLHQMGTCSTGLSERSGVVDRKLRVFNTRGLRVADVSVVPLSLRAHMMAPAAMIGEKVSDIIKEQYSFI